VEVTPTMGAVTIVSLLMSSSFSSRNCVFIDGFFFFSSHHTDSNKDGSYYYKNDNGSNYYNDGKGNGTYTSSNFTEGGTNK